MTIRSPRETKRRTLTWKDKQLAERIRELRVKHDLTQEKLAELVGVNHSYIAYVENGYRGVSLPVLYKLADVFKIKVRDLFTF